MSSSVDPPYMVTGARAMAGELLLGRWLLARWEHLGPDEDLDSWKANLHAVCQEMGVELVAVDLIRRSLTLVFNGALKPQPTQQQVDDSVRAIEHARFMEREIGDKLSVQQGRT